ncbi:MAG: adenylate/guanylate cyclase domain-containing protein, partial [Treponema sp.]|nr:adenylate/guanylate cyclase domain-containing protein [Treponema sp.]
VNLASRLEGINKQYGTYTMCSKATMDSAVEHGFTLPFRNVGKVAVVGRKEPVLIYNPLTAEEKSVLDGFNDIYLKAYDLFEKGDFVQAKELFASIADKDPVSAKYVDKCAMLIKNPPENWQGFIQATEK